MDDKEIEVNGKTFEKIYLENVIKMCEKFIEFASQLMMVTDPQPPN